MAPFFNSLLQAFDYHFTTRTLAIITLSSGALTALGDAARVDGANPWERFRHVVLPHLRPVTTFVLVLSTIGAFRVFTEMYVLTKGGPENSTRTISLYAYNTAFTYWNMGYASALSFVLLGIVLLIALIQLRSTRGD